MKTWNAVLGCLVVTFLLVSSACASEWFEIRLAPRILVLSSSGGKLTVHTNVPYRFVLPKKTELRVNDQKVKVFWQFYDDRGNLVVQCTKQAVKEIVGDVSKRRCTATVSLSVALTYGGKVEDSATLFLKK